MLVPNQNTTPGVTDNENSINSTIEINKPVSPINSLDDFKNSFSTMLPDNSDENRLQKARRILGATAVEETDEDLQLFLTNLQYLIDSWFDSFEKEIFDGSTLKQQFK